MLNHNVPEDGFEMIEHLGGYKKGKKNRCAIMEERITQKAVQKACFKVIIPFSLSSFRSNTPLCFHGENPS